jgi:hypothetical protein
MTKREILPTIVMGLLALLQVVLPIWTQRHIYIEGPNPPKQVAVRYFPLEDPLSDINQIGANLSLNIKVRGQSISNILVEQTNLINTGEAPILPSDFVSNLSLKVAPPWQIVTIKNASSSHGNTIPVKWLKVTDREFQAPPTLLNPGDIIWVKVFLNDPALNGVKAENIVPIPKLQWGGHIINLTKFSYPPNITTRVKQRTAYFPFVVSLEGSALLFTIVIFLASLSLYLVLMQKAKAFERWNIKSAVVMILLTFISLASAEAAATYIFGSMFTDIFGVSNMLNVPWIVANIFLIFFMFFYFRNGRSIHDWWPAKTQTQDHAQQ